MRSMKNTCVWFLMALLIVSSGCEREAPKGASPGATGTEGGRLEQSPRHHEWVDLTTATGRTVRAYVTYPEVSEAATAVVIIHENRGLTPWVRGLADQASEAGYVAIAPDLLSGSGPAGGGTDSFASGDAARKAIGELPSDQVLSDLDAATDYVRGLASTTDQVSVTGFCWGGGQAFDYACHRADIEAAFVFYGRATDADRMAGIRAPVYGFYGGNDHRITASVPEVTEAMQARGKTYLPVVYDGAGHGFMRSGEADDADPADVEARNKAWTRWTTLHAEF